MVKNEQSFLRKTNWTYFNNESKPITQKPETLIRLPFPL